jgi:hypothetical protein
VAWLGPPAGTFWHSLGSNLCKKPQVQVVWYAVMRSLLCWGMQYACLCQLGCRCCVHTSPHASGAAHSGYPPASTKVHFTALAQALLHVQACLALS